MTGGLIVGANGGAIVGPSGGGGRKVQGASAVETLIQSFTITETSGSTSPVLVRFGLPFVAGDVPSTSALVIRRNSDDSLVDAVQFDERVTWPSDGSLKFTVCHMRDETDLAGSGSRTYDVYAVSNSSFDNTGTFSLSDVTTDSTWTAEFSSHSQPTESDTTNHIYSLDTAAGTATRVTKIHSGPVCDGWVVWELKNSEIVGEWHVDAWNDGSDTTNGNIECALVLGLPFWDVAGKDRHDYTLTLKENASTVETYTGVEHYYHCWWATVRTDNDDQNGKRHWQTTSQMPTLLYKQDRDYWRSTGMIPPWDTSASYTATTGFTGDYAPPTTTTGNFNHRASINDGSSYNGRGGLPNQDANAFLEQTASQVRKARVNAFAGLHLPWHYRTDSSRDRSSKASDAYNDFSGESSDTANTMIPLILQHPTNGTPSSTTYNADGLPNTQHAYRGTSATTESKGGYAAVTATTPAAAIDGPWSNYTTDVSHGFNPSVYMYMLEGERYFYDATLSLAMSCLHRTNGNEFGGRPKNLWHNSGTYQPYWSISTTDQWGGVVEGELGNFRYVGFAASMTGYGWGLCPDNDVHKNYCDDLITQAGDYVNKYLSYIDSEFQASSQLFVAGDKNRAFFMGMNVVGCWLGANVTENADWVSRAEVLSNWTIAAFDENPHFTDNYNYVPGPLFVNGASDESPVIPPYLYVDVISATIDTGTDVITATCPRGLTWTADDRIMFRSENEDGGAVTFPSELTAGTTYYVINPTGGTSFQISTSSGGSAVDFTSSTSGSISVYFQDQETVIGANSTTIGDSDYSLIHHQGLVMAHNAGYAAATQALVDKATTFVGGHGTLDDHQITWCAAEV